MIETKYVIIPVSDIYSHLSGNGINLLQSARKSTDGSLVIRTINHPKEKIDSIFIEGFDWESFLANYPILTKEQASDVMNTPEWDLTEDE